MLRSLLVTALLACLTTLPAFAAGADTDADASAEKAREVLMAAAQFLGGQPMAAFTMEYAVGYKQGEEEGGEETPYQVAIAGPNRFSISDDEAPFFIRSDGEHLMTRFPDRFSVEPAPKNFAGMLQSQIIGLLANQDAKTVLALLSPATAEPLLARAQLAYAGQEELDGVQADHLTLEIRGRKWDVYIAAGDEPVLLKLVPDMSSKINRQGREAGISLQAAFNFSDWDFDSPQIAEAFLLSIPAKAEFVENVFGREEGPHPLVGAKAPKFTLETDGGEEVSLADLTKKNVVILDFWATWCGPCVAAFPTLTSVAEAYADKGVVFYAVNLRESPKKVADFLEDKDYALNVLYDTDGKVAGNFKVSGIPQSVIIGKDGRVQVVHVGVAPDLKSRLTEELDALLAGKDLARETVEARKREQARLADRLAELKATFAKKRATTPVGS